MRIYEVRLIKTVSQKLHRTIVVTAADPEDARRKALENASAASADWTVDLADPPAFTAAEVAELETIVEVDEEQE